MRKTTTNNQNTPRTHDHHRSAHGHHQRDLIVAHHARTQRGDTSIAGRPLDATVPGKVVVAAIIVALSISLEERKEGRADSRRGAGKESGAVAGMHDIRI